MSGSSQTKNKNKKTKQTKTKKQIEWQLIKENVFENLQLFICLALNLISLHEMSEHTK